MWHAYLDIRMSRTSIIEGCETHGKWYLYWFLINLVLLFITLFLTTPSFIVQTIENLNITGRVNNQFI